MKLNASKKGENYLVARGGWGDGKLFKSSS
jgi:hypothetical protein